MGASADVSAGSPFGVRWTSMDGFCTTGTPIGALSHPVMRSVIHLSFGMCPLWSPSSFVPTHRTSRALMPRPPRGPCSTPT